MTETPNRSVTRVRRLGVVAGTAVLLTGFIAGCGNDNNEDATPTSTTSAASDLPVVTGTWARAATAGGNSAIYVSITGGGSTDQLLKVSAADDLAESIEIHETAIAQPSGDDDHDGGDGDHDGGDSDSDRDGMPAESDRDGGDSDHDGMDAPMGGQMKTMRPVEMIEVPAGEEVELAPGGYHVMVMNLRADLSVGDSIPITLTFKNAGEIKAIAKVKEF